MKKYNKYILILMLIILFCSKKFLYSQEGSIRGFVYEKETGEPVIFTNVYLKGTTYGSTTDVNGYYSITKIPPGTYTLMVTYLGFDTIQEPITIKANEIITKKIYLKKADIKLKTVEISAAKEELKTEVKTSVIKITPLEVKQIPMIGGQADLAQYIQVIPGVVFTGDQGGQLYIRGGAPIQNKVLLDGMIIYNPFHSIGLFSVFDMDIIRNAEIYTGGFNAQYGGRISSVMDITTRDGNKKKICGKVATTTFGSNIMLEGPIKKLSDEKSNNSSFILSAKNSYLKESSKIFYKNIDTAGLPFNYTDLYGKISFNTDNGSKINIFGFNFTDNANYQSIANYNWNSYGIGTNFIFVPTGFPSLLEGNFALSSYKISMTEKNLVNISPRQSLINGFNLGFNYTYFYGKNTLNYGFEVLGFTTDFNFTNSVGRIIQQKDNTTEIATFIKYKFILGKFIIEPGFRGQYYSSLSNFSPEPRLGIKYNILNWLRYKISGGFYSQNLISSSSDRDVVNLFYGFLSGPENLQTEFNGKAVTHKLQKANHLVNGFEIDILKNVEVNIEAYNKEFTQLTNINKNKIYDDTGENWEIPDYYKKDFIIETGYAQGLDFSIKYDIKRAYFWGVYSLGYLKRFDGKYEYNPHYDRRHNVNLVGVYRFGAGYKWEIDVRWNFGSGFPFTQTQGFYELIDFSDGITQDLTTTNGSLGILYSEINKGRLPDYHRLDATIKREVFFSENTKLEISAGATNIYNRKNIFYYNRIRNERINQLPFMWNFGLNLTF